MSAGIDPALGLERVRVGENVLIVVHDGRAHTNGRAHGHHVAKPAIGAFVLEILGAGDPGQSRGQPVAQPQALVHDAVQVRELLEGLPV